jgi:hypothetical protein
MKTPHKHAELIKAWADGAEIEMLFTVEDNWVSTKSPSWYASVEYRIKPEPKPDHARYTHVFMHGANSFSGRQSSLDNLKLTFCGETGKLKSAEVLK